MYNIKAYEQTRKCILKKTHKPTIKHDNQTKTKFSPQDP
jgi:hypothetical protein